MVAQRAYIKEQNKGTRMGWGLGGIAVGDKLVLVLDTLYWEVCRGDFW